MARTKTVSGGSRRKLGGNNGAVQSDDDTFFGQAKGYVQGFTRKISKGAHSAAIKAGLSKSPSNNRNVLARALTYNNSNDGTVNKFKHTFQEFLKQKSSALDVYSEAKAKFNESCGEHDFTHSAQKGLAQTDKQHVLQQLNEILPESAAVNNNVNLEEIDIDYEPEDLIINLTIGGTKKQIGVDELRSVNKTLLGKATYFKDRVLNKQNMRIVNILSLHKILNNPAKTYSKVKNDTECIAAAYAICVFGQLHLDHLQNIDRQNAKVLKQIAGVTENIRIAKELLQRPGNRGLAQGLLFAYLVEDLTKIGGQISSTVKSWADYARDAVGWKTE